MAKPHYASVAQVGRLLDALRSPSADVWARFGAPRERYALGAVFFLLDKRQKRDVQTFIMQDVERLLLQLQRRTERVQVTYEGQVRSKVHWTATNKARLTDDYNPTRFVCREVRNQYDTPENQVVKYVVNCIANCLAAVPAVVESGFCCDAAEMRRAPQRVMERCDNLEVAVQRFHRNVYMRQVALPPRIDDERLRRAESCKLPEYQAAVEIYRAYVELCEEREMDHVRRRIVQAANAALPLAGGDDATAGLWIELAAELLREQMNNPQQEKAT